MKIVKHTFIYLLLISFGIFAQTKELPLKQIILKSSSFAPQKLKQLSWQPGTNMFSYVKKINDTQVLVVQKFNSDKTEQLLPLEKLNKLLTSNGFSKADKFPSCEWMDKDVIRFWKNNNLFRLNLSNNSLSVTNTVDSSGENLDYTTNDYAAFTIKNNLFISIDGKQKQVTFDQNEDIVNGQAVHRNEFGITKGTFWSPKNNYLAFYRMDQTMVTNYPLVDISTRPAKLVNIKYPMAGMKSHQVTVGIYNVKTGNTIWLQTGEPKDQYLTGVTWSPDEKYIYIAHLNRKQNHMRLIKYNAATGKPVKTLFEEESDKYVEPEHGPIFLNKNPGKFIWFSKRDGWNHLYLYDSSGTLLKQLTKGEWEVTNFDGTDTEGKNIFFSSTKESYLERHYYKLNISSGKITRLTNEHGTHIVKKDADAKYFLDTYNSTVVPNKTIVVNNDGKTVNTVFVAANPIMDYKIGKLNLFTLKTKNNIDLSCRIILPPDFDSTKKYPALVYVYGGPHVQLIKNVWLGGARLWLYYMAQSGYVVFSLDNRGSANRGLAFEQATYKRLGTVEIEDQTTGVNYLKSLSFVDTTRMGVHGWSFGGFMTTSLMTRTPNLFKVGAAGGAVIDWSYYEVMYTERYMQTLQTNPEGYKNSSLLNYIGNLKGKLLEVHGTMDPVVVWQNTLLLAKKAADLGIPLDYYPYPGQQHGIRGVDAFHLYQKITNYFNENLK